MRFVTRVRSLWRSLRRLDRVDVEMEEEMRFHIDMEAARLERERGLPAGEARRQALLSFGGVDQHREAGREARGLGFLSGATLDFRLGLRMLVRYPGLTVVGGLALAFAIFVGAATFEFLTQFIDPDLPLDEGDRIAGVVQWDAASGGAEPRLLHELGRWRAELESLEELGAFRTTERNLIVPAVAAEPVRLAEMSAAGSAWRGWRPPSAACCWRRMSGRGRRWWWYSATSCGNAAFSATPRSLVGRCGSGASCTRWSGSCRPASRSR